MNPKRGDQIGLSFAILAMTLAVMLALYIPAGPRKKYLRSTQDLQSAQTDLKLAQDEVQMEKLRLKEQEQLMKVLDARDPAFDLFSYVNSVLKETNLLSRAKLGNFRLPRLSAKQPMVQLTLQGVNVQELTDFFHKIYASGNAIVVYEIDRMQPLSNNNGLECSIKLMTVKT